MDTGHPGGACTVHANDAESGLTRIKSLAQEDKNATGDLKELIGEAIDVVVSIVHIDLGGGKKSRKVNDIIELKTYDSKEDRYIFKHIIGGISMKSVLKKINKQNLLMLSVICFVMAVIITTNHGTALAQSVGFNGDTVGDIEWPWMKFFNSLAEQFTGPLPMVLGILGLAGCAIAMFTGNAGGGTTKFIVLIFVVSTCLFAPSFISYVSESAGGLTIMGVM